MQFDGALCEGRDPMVWFPEHSGEKPTVRARLERRAKQVCAACPVLGECRRFARASRQPFGVWGGETADERMGVVSVDGVCGLPDCGEPFAAKGMCKPHYYRWRTYGDPFWEEKRVAS